jgi:predicted acylesterase/phospholipase RssA
MLFNDMFVLQLVSLQRLTMSLLLSQLMFTDAYRLSPRLPQYHNVVCAALDFVCDAPVGPEDDPIPTDARLAFFNETRHAYGRTALLLSGGAALGFYHVGVVKTLMENNLMPRVIGGSSAGSIVCAMIGTRTDEECIHDLFDARGTDAPGHSGKLQFTFFRPLSKQKKKFKAGSASGGGGNNKAGPGIIEVYENTAGAFHDAKRLLQGLVPIPLRHFSSFIYDIMTGNRRAQDVFKSDTEYFRECVRANVGNFTFQEAFDRTGRILNIVVTPKNNSDPPRLLNYLPAPHVLVWSAAVASSSLPGVFEANRLVVKEADGWERYESGDAGHFSDGSMEQDLPMQQLSEMFNVNHFIISQANVHAVMFASYNQKISVWTNPFTGLVSSILTFLKDQVRSWLQNLVQCVGARRISPVFQTQRGMGSQFFVQEYEGRPCDISLIPWLSHRGLFSALLHVIYNPSEAEFREWIQAAERETWRHIPAIKSHIAEEVTLDRCVQRLRKRLIHESVETRKVSTKAEDNLGSRVPSFFRSPSLVNMGGMAVTDQHNATRLFKTKKEKSNMELVPDISINSGWGGRGLRGNRSTANLQRVTSDASGLFIDEDEGVHTQDAGEESQGLPTGQKSSSSLPSKIGSEAQLTDTSKGYMKTTSMANFYYRRISEANRSYSGLDNLGHKTVSAPRLEQISDSDEEEPRTTFHQRRKSKSVADMGMSAFDVTEFFEPIKGGDE